MNKIFLEEMPPIELRSGISTQLDSTVLHDILTEEEVKHQAAVIIQRKFRQYMAKHILDHGKNKKLISDKSEITISQHKVSIINSGKAPLNDNAGSSKEDSEGAVHDKLLAKVDSSLTLDLTSVA